MTINDFEFDPYYHVYIKHTKNCNDIFELLFTQHMDTIDLVTSLDDKTLYTPYASGKWTIMEILIHLMDTERIFLYRALRIARGDKTPLPGFDQDFYVTNSMANGRKILDVVKEFSVLRSNTIEFFKGLNKSALKQTGMASDKLISAGAIAYVIAGHEIHHVNVIEERYIGKY